MIGIQLQKVVSEGFSDFAWLVFGLDTCVDRQSPAYHERTLCTLLPLKTLCGACKDE